MKKYYFDSKKTNINDLLRAITAEQTKRNVFVNITRKPYTGKKYDADTVIIVG